jgi:hypothetical protein
MLEFSIENTYTDETGLLPREFARAILDAEFSERDKARMHDLAVRNREAKGEYRTPLAISQGVNR